MDQKVKLLFLQTLNANPSVRNNAEQQLSLLEKNEDFMLYIKKSILEMDFDKQIQQIASIYFMNTIVKNWTAPSMKAIVEDLQVNILNLLKTENRYPRLAWLKVLGFVLNNSEDSVVEALFMNVGNYLKSSDPRDVKVALTLVEELFKLESPKIIPDKYVKLFFSNFGMIFAMQLKALLEAKEYALAATAFKIVAKSYISLTIPDFLLGPENTNFFLQLALGILMVSSPQQPEEDFIKVQRWAAYLIYKLSNKILKKFFKDQDTINFIKQPANLEAIYNGFSSLLRYCLKGYKTHERVLTICSDFFCLFASKKPSRDLVKSNYQFLLNDFIFPTQTFNENIKELFDYYPDTYLRNRYNCFTSNIYSSTSDLFSRLLELGNEIEFQIFSQLKMYLDQPSTETSSCLSYGIIGLLSGVQKDILRILGENDYNTFMKVYIFTNLKSKFPYLISQSLYYLSLAEQVNAADSFTTDSLNIIVGLIKADSNEILSVEASLALNVFLYNNELRSYFSPMIASIFERILYLSKIYYNDSLSDLRDSILDLFNEEIIAYAPAFSNTLCTGFLEAIENNCENDDQFAALASSLSTLERLIDSADDKPEIVKLIYGSASKVIYYIFKNTKEDFYTEAIAILSSFLFVFRTVDESLFEIFMVLLSSNMEMLAIYPVEIATLIDNYLSYGGINVITPQSLALLSSFLTILRIDIDVADSKDEDLIAYSQIVDSLMLNTGKKVDAVDPSFIPKVIADIIKDYDNPNISDNLHLLCLENVMQCYLVSAEKTVSALGDFFPRLFNEIIQYKDKFIRVYDKKIFILFAGELFKAKVGNAFIDYKSFANTFVEIFCSLPDAIANRTKLIEENEKKEDEDGVENLDEYSDYSSYSATSFHEDIYFVTILDQFDSFAYMNQCLCSIAPETFGEKLVSNMSTSQISQIKSLLMSSAK